MLWRVRVALWKALEMLQVMISAMSLYLRVCDKMMLSLHLSGWSGYVEVWHCSHNFCMHPPPLPPPPVIMRRLNFKIFQNFVGTKCFTKFVGDKPLWGS